MNARDHSNHLAALLHREREAMADFLLALSEFHEKKEWRELGYTSLFYYLHRDLGLSAGAAQHRKTAVELIQQHPAVEAALRQGRLCLSSLCELAKVVTPENVAEVLPRFFGLSRREAEVVAASIRPAAVIPQREVVTPVRAEARTVEVAGPVATIETTSNELHPGETDSGTDLVLTEPAAPAPSRPADSAEPLTAELSRLHITVSREFMETLDRTRDALSHSHPGASNEEILRACMQLMLDRKAMQKGLVAKPLKTPRPCGTDRVTADLFRALMKRSEGRCEFILANGQRCDSTYQLEVDHIGPRALGGPTTLENTRIACKAHNQLAARRVFGDEWMDKFAREGRKRAPRPNRSVRSRRDGKTGTGDSG